MTRDELYDLMMLPEGVDEVLPVGCPAWVSLKVSRLQMYFEGWKSPEEVEKIRLSYLDDD